MLTHKKILLLLTVLLAVTVLSHFEDELATIVRIYQEQNECIDGFTRAGVSAKYIERTVLVDVGSCQLIEAYTFALIELNN